MGLETVTLEQLISQLSASELITSMVSMIFTGLLIALLSFRFFKVEVVLSAIITGYDFGVNTLGTIIGDSGSEFSAAILLGAACAVIFGILALRFYKVLVYIFGGMIGFALGMIIPEIILGALGLTNGALVSVICLVCACLVTIPAAKIFFKAFKAIYICLTSFAGCVTSATALSILIFGADEKMLAIFVLAGLVLSVFAARVQFKMNRGREAFD